jgi:hypothetical protein
MRTKKYLFFVIPAGLLIILFLLSVKVFNNYPTDINLKHESGEFGATFSKKFCEELGLNWQEVYAAVLDDLKIRDLRLPAYWDEIEHVEGVYDFSDLDYMVKEAGSREARIIITLGRRQPRWPECHSPAWNNKKTPEESEASILRIIEATVNRYKDNNHIVYWQIENEAFLDTFGVCPPLNRSFLESEIALVRSLDDRKIMITASGELSSWKNEGQLGDIFGTTMYRVVYDKMFGFVRYPIPASFYRLKANLANIDYDRAVIIELQTEPWVAKGKMNYLTQAEVDRSMSIEQFKANLQYAINVDFKQTYVWGVEWWYFQKLYGNPEYWNIAKILFD